MEEEQIEIEWYDVYITFDVEFSYSPAYRGARSSLGVPEEPDEVEGFEIQKISCNGKEMLSLKEAVIDLIDKKLQDVCVEKREDSMADAEADRAEARWEAMMERDYYE